MKQRAIATVSLSVLALSGSARAAEPRAELSCQPEPSPGRVLCRLDVEVDSGRLVWGDALVVRAPAFARPLRARIPGPSAGARGGRRLELPVAFVAEKTGSGEVELIARAVVCRAGAESEKEQCIPVTRRARARLVVGVTEPGPR